MWNNNTSSWGNYNQSCCPCCSNNNYDMGKNCNMGKKFVCECKEVSMQKNFGCNCGCNR